MPKFLNYEYETVTDHEMRLALTNLIADVPTDTPQDYPEDGMVSLVGRRVSRGATTGKELPAATSKAKEAVREMMTVGDVGDAGWCLRTVRGAWDLPAVNGTAREAWKNATDKHVWTGDPMDIPFGAPVFSIRPDAPTSDAGHVFMCGGRTPDREERVFWGTDVRFPGSVSPFPIEVIIERWGHQVLGWSHDLNGFRLPLNKSPNQRDKR